jgi:hypothetical protein
LGVDGRQTDFAEFVFDIFGGQYTPVTADASITERCHFVDGGLKIAVLKVLPLNCGMSGR